MELNWLKLDQLYWLQPCTVTRYSPQLSTKLLRQWQTHYCNMSFYISLLEEQRQTSHFGSYFSSNFIQNIKEQFHHSTVRGQKWILGAVRGWLNHCIMEGSWHKWWLRSEVNRRLQLMLSTLSKKTPAYVLRPIRDGPGVQLNTSVGKHTRDSCNAGTPHTFVQK